MILPQDITPEKSLYVMGARIIESFRSETNETIDPKYLFDLYIKKYSGIPITYNYFLYALDWLFVLNAIELTPNNRLKRCY
jgi:hypothetical protein